MQLVDGKSNVDYILDWFINSPNVYKEDFKIIQEASMREMNKG